jgi:hypothetical protein
MHNSLKTFLISFPIVFMQCTTIRESGLSFFFFLTYRRRKNRILCVKRLIWPVILCGVFMELRKGPKKEINLSFNRLQVSGYVISSSEPQLIIVLTAIKSKLSSKFFKIIKELINLLIPTNKPSMRCPQFNKVF